MKKYTVWLKNILITVIMLLTCIIFLKYNREITKIEYISIGFVLLSELSFFVITNYLKKVEERVREVLLDSGILAIFICYILISCAFLYIGFRITEQDNILLLLNGFVIALVGGIVYCMNTFAKKTKKNEPVNMEEFYSLQQCEKMIHDLLVTPKYEDYKEELSKIQEEFIIADKEKKVYQDKELGNLVVLLNRSLIFDLKTDQELAELFSQILVLLEKRKI